MSAKFDHTQSTCASGKEWSTMKRHDEKDDTDKKPKKEEGFFAFASSKIEKLPQFDESESENESEDDKSSQATETQEVKPVSLFKLTDNQRPGIKLFSKGHAAQLGNKFMTPEVIVNNKLDMNLGFGCAQSMTPKSGERAPKKSLNANILKFPTKKDCGALDFDDSSSSSDGDSCISTPVRKNENSQEENSQEEEKVQETS